MKTFLFILLLSTTAFAQMPTHTLTTGFAYSSNNGNIIGKYAQGAGDIVPLSDGCTITDVSDQTALNAITIYQTPVVIPPDLCADYTSYMGLATSLGLPAQATTTQIQAYVTALEGDGSNQTNVNQAMKISLEFLALMNDIQQNGGSWSSITSC
jgi:hypothetical protein